MTWLGMCSASNRFFSILDEAHSRLARWCVQFVEYWLSFVSWHRCRRCGFVERHPSSTYVLSLSLFWTRTQSRNMMCFRVMDRSFVFWVESFCSALEVSTGCSMISARTLKMYDFSVYLTLHLVQRHECLWLDLPRLVARGRGNI